MHEVCLLSVVLCLGMVSILFVLCAASLVANDEY